MCLFAGGRSLSIIAVCSTLLGTILAAGAADLGPMPTKASVVAPMPASGWTFEFTPYLWATGLQGDIDVGPTAPLVSVDAGFDDIIKHTKFAFMGRFEARYDKWGLISDIAYLSVKVSGAGPLGFVDGALKSKTLFGTFVGSYRLVEQQSFWLDGLAGARAWWLSNTLDITAPGPTALSATRDQNWIDPIVGLRARAYVRPDLYLEFYGDACGLGVGAKSDWQVAGLLGYQYSRSVSLFGGYRYLAVNYSRDNFLFDVNMSGPVFGATFRF